MAQTGTGKTVAFLVPILQMIHPNGHVQALIVAPTRELAIQVNGEAEKLGRHLNVKSTAIYGGTSIGHQRREIFGGVDIVVGTPGRLIDFVKSAILRMRYIKWLVLDEADRMLDMGFIEDIDFLCRRAPLSRQTMLFSATLPAPVLKIAQAYMIHPKELRVSPPEIVAEGVRQEIHRVREERKMDLLLNLLRREAPERCLIFTARRESTGEIMRKLREKGFEAARLSSLQEQRHREGIMDMFRRGEVHILVATDVAGRGIDISGITHVINYDIPMEADDYVHRIGRTARAGGTGHAITFVTPKDLRRMKEIRELTGMDLPFETAGVGAGGSSGHELWEQEAAAPPGPRGRRRRRRGGDRARGGGASGAAGGSRGSGSRGDEAAGGAGAGGAGSGASGATGGPGRRRRRRGGRGRGGRAASGRRRRG